MSYWSCWGVAQGGLIASRRGWARALSSRGLANLWELWDEIGHAKSARARAASATNAHDVRRRAPERVRV